jgi:hypothetical protein
MSQETHLQFVIRLIAIIVVLMALVLLPVPLLPPQRLTEAVQSIFGLGWKVTYLVSAIGLEIVFYGSIGLTAAFVLKRRSSFKGRLLQTLIVPIILIGLALLIRSIKVGHLPVWINIVVPMTACLLGVWLGLSLKYQRWKFIVLILAVVAGVTFWGLRGGTSNTLTAAVEHHLQRLIAAGSSIPSGEGRFGALMRVAFSIPANETDNLNEVQNNRAAILALGIALGDERIARFVGLDNQSTLVRNAALLRKGTTLRKRNDWSRHFCLSASLAVLEHPLFSDAGGLMKEQLDALTGGSGFSFCDFAADRAGVKFASAATHSEADALAMQEFLKKGFKVDDFLPAIADLPENLTTEQFRAEFGNAGSDRYQQMISEIELRLNTCTALSPLKTGSTKK